MPVTHPSARLPRHAPMQAHSPKHPIWSAPCRTASPVKSSSSSKSEPGPGAAPARPLQPPSPAAIADVLPAARLLPPGPEE